MKCCGVVMVASVAELMKEDKLSKMLRQEHYK
jgi:hypothetical protein